MPDLSLIIPVYNEAGKVLQDVAEAYHVFNTNSVSAEIIIVDDGSDKDFHDVEKKCKSFCDNNITVNYIRLNQRRGKGFAVRTGILKSNGCFVAFSDSGCCIDYSNLIKAIELIRAQQCDIVHASRHMTESRILKDQTLKRKITGFAFRLCLNLFIKLGYNLSDTQCGFKIYRGQLGRKLYSESQCDGFLFDIEIIMLARKKNLRIKEIAVQWSCDRDTRLNPRSDFLNIIRELKDIKNRLG